MVELGIAPVYMVGSFHAITDGRDLMIGSGSGSQIAPYAYGAGTVLLVAGAQKLVRDIDEGPRRIREYSYPLEDARMKAAERPGTILAQILIMSYATQGRVRLFICEEPIGF